nr:truncated Rpl36 [Elymus ciliaris]
MKIELPS